MTLRPMARPHTAREKEALLATNGLGPGARCGVRVGLRR
jgi:hypothetical protein